MPSSDAPGAAVPAEARHARETRIDALRGLAMVLIYWDHGMLLARVYYLPLMATPSVISFFDASEVFVFIAGVVFGRGYGPICGWSLSTAQLRALGRAGELWAAQMALTAATIAVCLASDGALPMAMAAIVTRLDAVLVAAPLLRFHALCLDILPLYIALILIAPLGLALFRRLPALAVGFSAGLWGLTQRYPAFNLGAPLFPGDPRTWAFNPFSWQLLFLGGAWLAMARPSSWLKVRPAPTLDALATLLVFGGALAKTLWLVVAHGPPADAPTHWEEALRVAASGVVPGTAKQTLGPLRLLQLVAGLWLVVRLLPAEHRVWSGRISRALAMLGRHSLPIFCATVILDYGLGMPLQPHRERLLLVWGSFTAGLVLLLGLARLLDEIDRAKRARPPAP